MLLGKVADAIVILTVVLVNTLVGFVQEVQASKAIDALSRMVPSNTTVLRDASPQQVPAQEIVPGDVVLLQAGDRVPTGRSWPLIKEGSARDRQRDALDHGDRLSARLRPGRRRRAWRGRPAWAWVGS
jgi:hypothetical protein